MKTLIILPLIISLFACSTWKKQNEARQTILLDKFDIKKFEELQKAKQDFYFLEDSTKVTLSESNSQYQESKKIYKSHFSSNKLHFKETKTLNKTGEYFQRFPIGIHKEYDKKGRLKSVFNFDSIFPFNLDNLAKKFKKEYAIDFLDVNRKIAVDRNSNFKPPYYDVHSEENRFTYRLIRINGLDGNLFMDTTIINNDLK